MGLKYIFIFFTFYFFCRRKTGVLENRGRRGDTGTEEWVEKQRRKNWAFASKSSINGASRIEEGERNGHFKTELEDHEPQEESN